MSDLIKTPEVLERCLRLVQARGRVRRSDIANSAHVNKKTLDEVRDTLEDRALVTILVPKTGGRSGEVWYMPNAKDAKKER